MSGDRIPYRLQHLVSRFQSNNETLTLCLPQIANSSIIFNLLCFSNVTFFFTGLEALGERELASNTLKLFEEQYDDEKVCRQRELC